MPNYIVDMSRTMSRIGRGFATGIDRVETEYIRHFAEHVPGSLFVSKLGNFYALLNAKSALDIIARIEGSLGWGWPFPSDAVRLKLNWEQRCARSFTKRKAIRLSPRESPMELFTALNLDEFEYLNVGHSNLTSDFLAALKKSQCAAIRIMIHDMIPLDYPQFSQAHIPEIFEARMRAVAEYADQIICNSEETRKRASYYFHNWGGEPDYVVAHLGIERMSPSGISPLRDGQPYYVVLGTIEPRKNHVLLFRVWERLASELAVAEVPSLYVIGRRGWNNIEAFQFLDESALINQCVFEKADLRDEELADLLAGAEALLFPSFVEGFGLPALEAAQLGVPVLCSDLSTFHENLGDYACYLDPNTPMQWAEEILKRHTKADRANEIEHLVKKTVQIPTWDAHFRHVFG